MTALLNRDHCVAGTVKFDASVSVEKLAGFISEMKSRTPERWVDLHIRGVGGDGTHYIAFHYILSDGEKKTHKKAVNSLLQYLRDQLGTRPKQGKKADPVPQGVMGWSISTVDVVI
jgi:hypothetical protein